MAVVLPGLAVGEPLTDLHDVAVGMTARELPTAGYRDLMCAGRNIAAWSDWASCPVGDDGLRAVRIAYDQPGGDTKVAGHPVVLTIYFDGSGRLAKIRIRTDDHIAPYLRKKAYMLARQAKAHYGEGGWRCDITPASADEEPIGPVFINESCIKLSADRRIEVSARLSRTKGGTPRDFVSETTISIAMVPAASK